MRAGQFGETRELEGAFAQAVPRGDTVITDLAVDNEFLQP